MEQTIDNDKRIGIVADDLTSAADGASAFLTRGYTPLICRKNHSDLGGPVLSIDTGSRLVDERHAAHLTGQAIAALAARCFLYKTIDSTLRGHIRAEIAAAFRASGRQTLVVAPAFPAAGRTTAAGVQLLHGVPVGDTAYGQDPVHPARASAIEDLINPDIGKTVVLPANLGDAELARRIGRASVIIVDAHDQAMLNRRVATIATQTSALWVGSPGMAEALSNLVPLAKASAAAPVDTPDSILVLVGSANHVSHVQCDTLASTGVSVGQLASEIDMRASVACLRAPQNRTDDPSVVLASLLDQAEAILSRRPYGAVIATGGETMDGLMERLSIRSFVLLREIEPGFPLAMVRLADGNTLLLALKAGGFGSVMTLRNAADTILRIGKDRP